MSCEIGTVTKNGKGDLMLLCNAKLANKFAQVFRKAVNLLNLNFKRVHRARKTNPIQQGETYKQERKAKQCKVDGISFAKQAAAVNATVSDIYTRLEGRQGKGREGRGDCV